jgi:hypothetical protein
MKTNELTGAALDWAVTLIEKPNACEYGVEDWRGQRRQTVKNGEYVYRWHQSWAQGGPIIEREGISLIRQTPDRWVSEYSNGCGRFDHARSHGPTPLIAAMRCYVASKLGDDINIPEELL